jgi:hypothetical protein
MDATGTLPYVRVEGGACYINRLRAALVYELVT